MSIYKGTDLIAGMPALATVATSGDYNDLTNKPDLTTKADVDLSNLNTSGKSFASSLGMPSSRYIDITLGASGATYTAPANGYIAVSASATQNGWFAVIFNNFQVSQHQRASWTDNISDLIPVKKGNIWTMNYDAIQSWDYLRFIYAEGEENV
jgi:hypothetical protein